MKKKRYLTITFDEANIRFLEVSVKKNIIVHVHNSFIIENSVISDNNALDEEKWISILKKLKKKRKIKAKIAHINIPTSSVILRQQTMPDVSIEDLKQMLTYEIGSSIHLPFNNPVFDIIKSKIESEENDNENVDEENDKDEAENLQSMCNVTFIATPGNLIYPLIESLEEEKIKVKKIDIPSLSLYQLFKKLYPRQKYESILIIQIRRDGIDLTIIDEKTIWFTRHVHLSIFDYIDEEFGEENIDFGRLFEKIDDKEQLKKYITEITNEIERAINFYKYTLNNRGNIITGCWIASEFLFEEEYYDYIQEHLDLEINSLYARQLLGFEAGMGSIYKEVKKNGN